MFLKTKVSFFNVQIMFVGSQAQTMSVFICKHSPLLVEGILSSPLFTFAFCVFVPWRLTGCSPFITTGLDSQ